VLSKNGKVTEAEMAEVLDYPWALPEEGIGEDEYVEVGYPSFLKLFLNIL
jgi:hypothetical protein